MKLACQETLVPGRDLRERLDNLARWGYEGIEFHGNRLDKARVDEIVRLTQDGPVRPAAICAGFGGCLLDPDPEQRRTAVADIKTLLGMAADMGAAGLIVVPIFGKPRLPDLSPLAGAVDLEHQLLRRLLADVAAAAEQIGATVLLEPLNRYETHFLNRLAQAVEVCRAVDSPRLRVMADFFHMHIEEADIPSALAEARQELAYVHLADSNRQRPGRGHTDFRPGFAALRRIGYAGYMSLECGVPEPREHELATAAEYLRAAME